MEPEKYLLLDSNVTAAYYLPRSCRSKRVCARIQNIFDSVRSGHSRFFFYLPNFCVAEVFSVFMKHSFGSWNRHIQNQGTIDTRHYSKLVKQFESDIHNGKFIYHYELARYHVLAINLVAPIDHYFQVSRSKKKKNDPKGRRTAKPDVNPMSTFDHLIIAMGIHLARIHGPDRVSIVSADKRLIDIMAKCRSDIPFETKRRLKLDRAEAVTGIEFNSSAFPSYADLLRCKNSELSELFGAWPLPTSKVPGVYRYLE